MTFVCEDKKIDAVDEEFINKMAEIQNEFETIGRVLICAGLYDSYSFLNSSHKVFVEEIKNKIKQNK